VLAQQEGAAGAAALLKPSGRTHARPVTQLTRVANERKLNVDDLLAAAQDLYPQRPAR